MGVKQNSKVCGFACSKFLLVRPKTRNERSCDLLNIVREQKTSTERKLQMSHFFVAVIVPETTEEEVEKLLAPYNENLEVPEYKKHLSQEDIDFMKKHYQKEDPDFQDTEAYLIEKYPDWNGCDLHKDETGLYYLSTYNPKSKWDWYSIGGRWDGCIQGEERPSTDDGFNFGDEHHQLTYNSCKVSDYLQRCEEDPSELPYSIVTPDGVWHEKGKMGWWGISTDEKDDWKGIALNLLETHKNLHVIGVDCHI